MSDFQRQLRRHYESQQLSPERVREILEVGRRAAAKRARLKRLWLAAAAIVAISLAWVGTAQFRERSPSKNGQGIAPDEIAAAVTAFFSRPDYRLSRVSVDSGELMRWLRTRGAPAGTTIPPALDGLPSFGCEVLEVRGQQVFLICFFLDGTAAERVAGGAPMKEKVVTAPDGTTMKKDRPLVHLVVAPRASFRTVPEPGARTALPARGEWNFRTWVDGDLVYLVAAAAPAETLGELSRAL